MGRENKYVIGYAIAIVMEIILNIFGCFTFYWVDIRLIIRLIQGQEDSLFRSIFIIVFGLIIVGVTVLVEIYIACITKEKVIKETENSGKDN